MLFVVVVLLVLIVLGEVWDGSVSQVSVVAHSSSVQLLDGGALGSGLFNSLLGMSFSLIGVDSVSLLAGISQCLVGVSAAVFLHIDGSSVEVASSESDSLGGGVVVVGELRNSASLLGGVLLDDSVVCGLVLVSLSVEPEGLWEGRWLSWVLGVVLVPSGMSSEEIFS